MTDRVISLIDMDCFYCQVETKLNPELKGLPLAVVQYNEWKGGGIIAVNYEARDRGVTRYMRGQDAKEQCPEIVLVKVPTLREKADLSRYRDAGREVVSVLCTFSESVQRASVDEAYLDLTNAVNKRISEISAHISSKYLSNTFIVGYTKEGSNNEEERLTGLNSWLSEIYDHSFQDAASQRLAVGAMIVEEIRKAVYDTTGFRCSAGIGHNKIMAKLVCGLHKPNRQTIVPQNSVHNLFKTLPPRKVRSLGGKLGDDLTDRLGIKVMADLLKYSENELQKIYDSKTGTWLYNIARGYDYEQVTPRLLSKSIGCCKKFPGRTALSKASDINHWVTKLAEELLERLQEDQMLNKRRAQLLTISMSLEINRKDIASSKSLNLVGYNLERIITTAYCALKKSCTEEPETKIWSPPIKYLGLSAGKFINETSNKIINFFKTTKISVENALKETDEIEEILNDDESIEENVELPVELNKNMSNNNYNKSKEPSFFEKLLLKGSSNNEGKLKLIPDLNKRDLYSDNENSTDSCTSEKLVKQCDTIEPLRIDTQIKSETKNYSKYNKDDETKIKIENTKKNTISSFFSSSNVKEKWINPEEIFPDITNIDDDIMNMFPLSFKKKVLELKKVIKNTDQLNECTNSDNCDKDNTNQSSSSFTGVNTNAVFNNGDYIKQSDNSKNCDLLNNNKNSIIDKGDENRVSSNLNNSAINATNNITTNSSDSDFIKCKECGENISILYQEIHLDHHLAMKLDNELNHRTNFQISNNKSKLINSAQHQNKRKTKCNDINSKIVKKTKGIEAFFKK